ncbi:MAG TPA: M56 family metallopeptidase [Candidatus Angelobacter sp.]|jgi:beta-lactamase regulating signal transducer with metallopeptidase domain
MSAELSLHFAAIFLSFFLRVATAYFACWLLNRLLRKPQHRFALWMIFLAGSAVYWLALVFQEFRSMAAPTATISSAGAAPVGIHSFSLPLAWSHSVLIVMQSAGFAYIAAVLLLMAVTAWKHFRLRLFLRRAIAPSQSLTALFNEVRGNLGVLRGKLVVLPGLKSPATAGWWNPQILLPEVCEELGPTNQLADVLCHELVHVERRDYFWAGVSDLICCLLFFHPAVWGARKSLRMQGELACDLAVLKARPGDRADYADSLTYFVRLRMLQEGFSLGVDFAASAALGLRIRTILAAPTPVPWWRRVSHATAGLALLAGLGIVAPALTFFLGFSEPVREQASVAPALKTSAQRSLNVHHFIRGSATQPQNNDSLTTLRTQRYVPETTAYSMRSGSSSERPSSERAEPDSPAWTEAPPAVRHPSVSSVVRSTLGEIAAGTIHGRRDHDRDDH